MTVTKETTGKPYEVIKTITAPAAEKTVTREIPGHPVTITEKAECPTKAPEPPKYQPPKQEEPKKEEDKKEAPKDEHKYDESKYGHYGE